MFGQDVAEGEGPLLVGNVGLSAGIAFLTFVLVKLIEARSRLLVRRPLPAMDVNSRHEVPLSYLGVSLRFTLNSFTAGTRTVTVCPLSL